MTVSKRSSINRLPDAVKKHIERRIAQGKLTLDELIKDLQQAFPEHKEALPSRSAVHRYGQKLENRLAAIRASTEAARIIREHAGDREDARSEALTAMIQSELFESILHLQEATDEAMPAEKRIGLLGSAAKNIATLTRSSVNLKKYQEEAVAIARAELLAEQEEKFEAMRGQDGMSEQLEEKIRQVLLGKA